MIVLKPTICHKENGQISFTLPRETSSLPPLAATIGVFDGVHLGHRSLLNTLKKHAYQKDLYSAVITFATLPIEVLEPEVKCGILTTLPEKLYLLQQSSIDYVIVIPFNSEVAHITAEVFLQDILQKVFNVHTLFIGYDHRFGYNRNASFEDYLRFGQTIGMEIRQASPLHNHPSGHTPSSTRIRTLIQEGRTDKANSLLGYNYLLSGTVEGGFKIGRTIGYPTANIRLSTPRKLLPPAGVYAVRTLLDKEWYPSMMYFGNRPTLQVDLPPSLEVNLLDFQGDLYGSEVMIELCSFVRGEMKFDNIEILKKQIAQDERVVRDFFARKN